MIKGKVNRLFDDGIMPSKDVIVIYSLFNADNECLYVGQTKDLKNRIYQHLLTGKEVDSFTFFECSKEDANNDESLTIIEKQPIFNKTLPKNDNFCSTIELRRTIEERITELSEDIPVVFSGNKSRQKLTYIKTSYLTRLLNTIEEEINKISKGE